MTPATSGTLATPGTPATPTTPGTPATSEHSEFDIEVPAHLAQDFGLTVLRPTSARIIRCWRPPLRFSRAA